jgi:glycosyltransferase involved in cell wall biosynthesis
MKINTIYIRNSITLKNFLKALFSQTSVETMKSNSANGTAQKPKILFVFADRRARYLVEELKGKINIIDFYQVKIDLNEPFFWVNLLFCTLEIAYRMIKKGKFTKISRRLLYLTSTHRPSYIREMSSRIEKHIDSMVIKPDLILQWQSIFAPYTETPVFPFALILDNYTDAPNSLIQKDKLRGWLTFYNESFYQFQRKLYSNAAQIFTLSKWCKEGLSREYNIASKKITTIGWGPAKKIASHKSSKKESKTILAVGNEYFAKGIDVLLKSAEFLKDFSITIVGKDRAYKKPKSLKNVQIMDHVSDNTIINLFLKSELFFIFSEFDPSPHVLWEAQACGCVIIGYDAYGISEAVVDGETGILMKTRDPILVAEEIRKLCQDKVKLVKMQQLAIENFTKNGTWDLVSRKIAKSLIMT